jgi:hypothetical protein
MAKGSKGPVSVVLPQPLRHRVASEAKRRGLKLSSTLRALASERLEELADQAELSRAEEWQRAQAWATWDKVEAGGTNEVSRDDLRASFDRFERAPRKR